MAVFEKAVVVKRKTVLEELIVRFTTVAQARFYLEHAGQSFEPIEAAHERYHAVLAEVRHAIPNGMKSHVIDRDYLPSYSFEESDLVLPVGQDGLVVNTAKYLSGQPMVAVNPDPGVFDGVLLPFTGKTVRRGITDACSGEAAMRKITMAEARLQDGQRLLGFNDLFIGANSHVSARYRIEHGKQTEEQSSSGIIISTGAGSTGWLKSVYAGAAGVITALGGKVTPPADGGAFSWESEELLFSVREPFPSKASQASLVHGRISRGQPVTITSHMSGNGVIFSDGIEQDYLPFNAGATATIGIAREKAVLVV